MEDVRAEPTDEPRLLVCGVDVEGESFSESFSRARNPPPSAATTMHTSCCRGSTERCVVARYMYYDVGCRVSAIPGSTESTSCEPLSSGHSATPKFRHQSPDPAHVFVNLAITAVPCFPPKSRAACSWSILLKDIPSRYINLLRSHHVYASDKTHRVVKLFRPCAADIADGSCQCFNFSLI